MTTTSAAALSWLSWTGCVRAFVNIVRRLVNACHVMFRRYASGDVCCMYTYATTYGDTMMCHMNDWNSMSYVPDCATTSLKQQRSVESEWHILGVIPASSVAGRALTLSVGSSEHNVIVACIRCVRSEMFFLLHDQL